MFTSWWLDKWPHLRIKFQTHGTFLAHANYIISNNVFHEAICLWDIYKWSQEILLTPIINPSKAASYKTPLEKNWLACLTKAKGDCALMHLFLSIYKHIIMFWCGNLISDSVRKESTTSAKCGASVPVCQSLDSFQKNLDIQKVFRQTRNSCEYFFFILRSLSFGFYKALYNFKNWKNQVFFCECIQIFFTFVCWGFNDK